MSTSSAVPGVGPDPVPGTTSTAAGAARPLARYEIGRVWWLSLIAGILWLLYGLLVLSLRPGSIASLAVLAGFAFIFGGVQQFVVAQRVESWRWLFYIGGVLGIIAGIMAFVWPGATLLVLAVFVSWYLVIGGIFTVVGAFVGPKGSWWWLGLIMGVLEFLIGAWAIGSPGRELLLLVNIVGFFMVFLGISEIFAAFSARSERQASPA
jgi:uncharacterized membrane protein HdeD (DUF308 family)